MQDFPPYQHPRSMMSRYPAEPANQATCACDQGNRLWLENHSGQDMSVAVTVGSMATPIGNPQNLLIAASGQVPAPMVTFIHWRIVPPLICLGGSALWLSKRCLDCQGLGGISYKAH